MENNLKGHYAGFVSRFLAYFIDIAVLTVTIVALGWFINAISDLFPLDIIPGGAFRILLASLAAVLLVFVYFIFFWTLIGQTPGKMMLGLRVVSVDGGSVTLWQAIRRVIGYLVSYILYLGYLWVLIDNHRQGWHDKIANTYVIYVWDARVGSVVTGQIRNWQETNQVIQE
jgi:uncharacterized RDD family membrane protein YckC